VGREGFEPPQSKHLIYSQARLSHSGAAPWRRLQDGLSPVREATGFPERVGGLPGRLRASLVRRVGGGWAAGGRVGCSEDC
jgi:hypothetical protein